MNELNDKTRLVERWSFRWETMDVLLGGRSPIDLHHLEIESEHQAKEFLKGYGYDPDVGEQRRFIYIVFVESMVFLERTLMPKEWQGGVRPPREIIE